jgi:hypothetical protein
VLKDNIKVLLTHEDLDRNNNIIMLDPLEHVERLLSI